MIYRIGPGSQPDTEEILYCFRMVPVDAVPQSTSELAKRITALVSSKLTLGSIQLRWFVPDPDRLRVSLPERANWRTTERAVEEFEFPNDPVGYTPKSRHNEIWIRVGLEKLDLIITIAHELKHLHQRAFEPSRFAQDKYLAEFDAYTFSVVGAEEFLLSSRDPSDSELQTVRNFGAWAIRMLAIDAIKAGWTPEQFRDHLSR
jgi:hypothetical protein